MHLVQINISGFTFNAAHSKKRSVYMTVFELRLPYVFSSLEGKHVIYCTLYIQKNSKRMVVAEDVRSSGALKTRKKKASSL